ncbi:MAG: PhoH family protein [Micrococcaceae bacterium]
MSFAESTINYPSPQAMVANLGVGDASLRLIENAFPELVFRANGLDLHISGNDKKLQIAVNLLKEMQNIISQGHNLSENTVEQLLSMIESKENSELVWKENIKPTQIMGTNIISSQGKNVRAKTPNQKEYVDAIDENTIVFGIGPAGTGKTYLAMAKAVQALQNKEVSRIILTRPAVEAGEKLGFLPGSLTDKIDPYLRPLYDALHEMIKSETIPKLMETGVIEVAPLAYMRGRTLNESFIILDEAQNTTPQQIKMFLTRLGFGSKVVVTGDTTQIDLPQGVNSGLKVVQKILQGIDDIHFAILGAEDVVRHPLVGKIVGAYDKFNTKKGNKRGKGA